jgi:glucose-1-phosphate cytidylyltransferase
MKVVLFCGGFGTRLREHSDTIPKPLVTIGYRPIIWHLMKYYSYYGFNDFILCLGYRGDMIKEYFLKYDETLSNNFSLLKGGKEIQLHKSDISNWNIQFIETGLKSNLGQRLKAVEGYLEGEDEFLVNYSDGLSDLPLTEYIDTFHKTNTLASFLSVRPSQSFHAVECGDDGLVSNISDIGKSEIWINGGFFVLKKEIFNYMKEGEELVLEPFQRLIEEKQLTTVKYKGFWAAIDTFKDYKTMQDMYENGNTPWQVWSK